MKILLSAFACAPDLGSEPALGWGLANAISAHEQVWVLTDICWKESIEQNPCSKGLKATPVFVRLIPGMDYRKLGYIVGGIYYFVWQFAAFIAAKRLNTEIHFDLVHHVSFACSWMPSFLGWLGIPFIWNGGAMDNTPVRFFGDMSWNGRLREGMRYIVQATLGVLVRRAMAQRARLIISPSSPDLWSRNLPIYITVTAGLLEDEIIQLSRIKPRTQGPLRVASVGRLIGPKGFALVVRAFAKLLEEFPDSEYWIVGDGPERGKLEKLARELRCESSVRFMGFSKRRISFFYRLSEIDILVHPCFHEQIGYVILEAMAAGRPVICLDIAGPSHLVPDGGGVRIIPRSTGQVVGEIHEALRQYANDRTRLIKAGEVARDWALQQWSWKNVATRLMAIYLEARPHRPEETAQPRAAAWR